MNPELIYFVPTFATDRPQPLGATVTRVKVRGKFDANAGLTLLVKMRGDQTAKWSGSIDPANISDRTVMINGVNETVQEGFVDLSYISDPSQRPQIPSANQGGGGPGGPGGPPPPQPNNPLGDEERTDGVITDDAGNPGGGNTSNPTEGTGVGEP